MAERKGFSLKRIQIDKANTAIVVAVAVTAFVAAFCIVATRSLLIQRSYKEKVIGKKENALRQLKDNIKAAETLKISFRAFVEQQPNVIGGSVTGKDVMDGDNARIVLDALPSKYDFPALATSLESLLISQNVTIEKISGTDDEIQQQALGEQEVPVPIEIPFDIGASSSYDSIQKLVGAFESSIRPFHIKLLTLSGNDATMKIEATYKTYFQPDKKLNIKTEVVK